MEKYSLQLGAPKNKKCLNEYFIVRILKLRILLKLSHFAMQ